MRRNGRNDLAPRMEFDGVNNPSKLLSQIYPYLGPNTTVRIFDVISFGIKTETTAENRKLDVTK